MRRRCRPRHDRRGAADPSPELRTKAIPVLLRLAGRDSRAREAIERAAGSDDDGIVRQAAADALGGSFVVSRKRYERRQRRRDRTMTALQPRCP